MNSKAVITGDAQSDNQHFLSLAEGRTAPPGAYDHRRATGTGADRLIRQVLRLYTGVKLEDDHAACQRLEMLNWRGDRLSDQALVELETLGMNPMRAIDTLLNEGIDGFTDPPESLRALWASISEEPDWLDWDKLEQGARVYRRYGVHGYHYQGVVSIEGYRKESIAQPLMATGQYSDDTAFDRFLLTCNFWTEVSHPGGMKLFSEGWKTAVRVRLLHTLIRRRVLQSENWDEAHLGMPINQAGLLATPMLGSLGMGYHMKLLGYAVSREEIEAMMHHWGYVARIMGLEDGLWPGSIEDGLQTLYNINRMEAQSSSEDSRRLGASFLECFKPEAVAGQKASGRRISRLFDAQRWRSWLQYRAVVAQSAFVISPMTRRFISGPNPLPWAIPYWLYLFPRNLGMSLLTRASKRIDEAYDRRVTRVRRDWMVRNLPAHLVAYQPAD